MLKTPVEMPLFDPYFLSPCLPLVFEKTAEKNVAMEFVNHLSNSIVTTDLGYDAQSSSIAYLP